jgi:hypothetical protein
MAEAGTISRVNTAHGHDGYDCDTGNLCFAAFLDTGLLMSRT